MEPTIFGKIAAGEIPSKKVWEDDNFMAFLDIHPRVPGHTLVIPKQDVGDDIFDLSDDDYQELMGAAKKVARLLKERLACDRVVVWVVGYDVPYVHVHLLPTNGGFPTLQEEVSLSEEEMVEIQQRITNT